MRLPSSPEAFREDLAVGQELLTDNYYPGRVAIMGLSADGSAFHQLYALGGRSSGSKNRVFVNEGQLPDGSFGIRTAAPGMSEAEMAEVAMSELIYYRAMRGQEGVYVVSNGAQTNPVFARMVDGATLEQAVRTAPEQDEVKLSWYEPDAPNFTPRITGVIDLRETAETPFGLTVVSRGSDDQPQYSTYEMSLSELRPGQAFGIQTYLRNGDPLPSFDRAPYGFELGASAEETAQRLWNVLNEETRVAVVAQSIDIESGEITDQVITNAIAA